MRRIFVQRVRTLLLTLSRPRRFFTPWPPVSLLRSTTGLDRRRRRTGASRLQTSLLLAHARLHAPAILLVYNIIIHRRGALYTYAYMLARTPPR